MARSLEDWRSGSCKSAATLVISCSSSPSLLCSASLIREGDDHAPTPRHWRAQQTLTSTIVQVRIIRKRLKVCDEQLAELVRTAANSMGALTKEANSRRRLTLPSA